MAHPSQHAGAAIKQGFEDTRCVLEPAGALALAGLKKHASSQSGDDVPTYVAVASGANMDFDRLRFVSERADTSTNAPVLRKIARCRLHGNAFRRCVRLHFGRYHQDFFITYIIAFPD